MQCGRLDNSRQFEIFYILRLQCQFVQENENIMLLWIYLPVEMMQILRRLEIVYPNIPVMQVCMYIKREFLSAELSVLWLVPSAVRRTGLWQRGTHRTATAQGAVTQCFNPLNAKLNPIYHFLAIFGAHHILHFSRIRVKQRRSYERVSQNAGPTLFVHTVL